MVTFLNGAKELTENSRGGRLKRRVKGRQGVLNGPLQRGRVHLDDRILLLSCHPPTKQTPSLVLEINGHRSHASLHPEVNPGRLCCYIWIAVDDSHCVASLQVCARAERLQKCTKCEALCCRLTALFCLDCKELFSVREREREKVKTERRRRRRRSFFQRKSP